MLIPTVAPRAENPSLFLIIGTNVSCGAEPRAGFADTDSQGHISGVAVDLCRAVAVALLGERGKVEFHLYESDQAIDKNLLRHVSISFLTRDAIREQKLAKSIQAGPVVFADPVALMVEQASPVQEPADLAGHTICFMTASPAQRYLETYTSAHALRFARLAFQEDVEMLDAYNVQRCQAAVGESTFLATMRAAPGVKHLVSRLLPTPLALNPIIAATGDDGDKVWSRLVFGVIRALISGMDDPMLGLRKGWREAVVASVGDFDTIIRRHLIDGLGLAPGLNQAWPKGVLLAP